MNKMLLTQLVVLLLYLPCALFAKSETVKEAGKPLQVKWDDGRIAEYAINGGDLITSDTPLQVSENTCTGIIPEGCIVRLYIRPYITALYWKKHTTPEKEGKILMVEYNTQKFAMSTPAFLFMDNRLQKDPLASTLPVDEIICPKYDWLPGFSGGAAPQKVYISKWNVERMEENPETGMLENRIVGGGDGVELESNAKNGVFIARAAKLFGPSRSLVLGGDIIAWVIRTAESQYCQMSIKVNTSKLQNDAYTKYYEIQKNFKPTTPYLWKSDSFSTDLYPSFFDFFLKKPDDWKPE